MDELETIFTKDGSTTLYNQKLDETYHSRHGAVQEAKHVFIKTGLDYKLGENGNQELAVFEMGFGTGLNCWLAGLWSHENAVNISYTGIESVKLHDSQINSCNYIEYEEQPIAKEFFKALHEADWEKQVSISGTFSIEKIELEIENFQCDKLYDVVFFDAFGPRVQPYLWEKPVLTKMFNLLNPGGVFVTYCAKGSVRRCLIELGFKVERLPGPPGKREMLRAIRPY